METDIFFDGESENVEYKEMLPKDSEKYIKTIIAFANTQGGKLIIGVRDRDFAVVGVDDEVLFKTMDSISNAVSDLCEPQIIPNIEPKTIQGKNVIVISVSPEPSRPYYLKSKGKDKGTYIRVAGTSRPADENKIKELEMEGSRISWDELICIGYKVEQESIESLCSDIAEYRKKAHLDERIIGMSQLINWNLLKETKSGLLATNAFVLLTSDYFPFSKTQCAVFKGTERSVFLDKREFSGALYRQIDEAINFVLKNIKLGAVIDGVVRKESYELPIEAIREMIINAHCHRSLTEPSCIQVAIYDDRLEVTSPGGLYNGLTFEEIMRGHSKIRNRAIANVFNQMGLVEAWGSGINRIIQAAKDYELRDPVIQVFDDMFRIDLFRDTNDSLEKHRRNIGKASEKHRRNIGETSEEHRRNIGDALNDTQLKILKLLEDNKTLSATGLSEKIGISKRNIENNIKKLKEKGFLKRHGSPKNGYWEVIR